MDNRTKTALTSGAFTPQRSQYAGTVSELENRTVRIKYKQGVGNDAIQALGENDNLVNTGEIRLSYNNDVEKVSSLLEGTDVEELYLPRETKEILSSFIGGTNAELKYCPMPPSLEKIGEGAFAECANWDDEITMPDTIKEIEAYAFVMCSKLTIILPDSIERVGEGAFSGIKHLYYHGDLEGAPWGAEEWN